MSDSSVERVRERLAVGIENAIAGTSVDVLVLGPNINRKKLLRGAKLRKTILDRCSGFGASVKGEHQELIDVAKGKLGQGHNLCTYEMKLAQICDLIVIVPDSPGSFAELGLFALQDDVCPKILVLFDQKHKDAESYIIQGPKRACEMRRAKIVYVDYGRIEEAWMIVQGAIEQVRVTKLDKPMSRQVF